MDLYIHLYTLVAKNNWFFNFILSESVYVCLPIFNEYKNVQKDIVVSMSILFKTLQFCIFILFKQILSINDIDSDHGFKILVSSVGGH
jgi:hypothetical protein